MLCFLEILFRKFLPTQKTCPNILFAKYIFREKLSKFHIRLFSNNRSALRTVSNIYDGAPIQTSR